MTMQVNGLRNLIELSFKCLDRNINDNGIYFPGIQRDAEEFTPLVAQVCIFHQSLCPIFYNEIHLFFNSLPFSTYRVLNLLMAHSTQIVSIGDNIFVGIIYIFSFAYSLLDISAKKRNDPRFKLIAGICISELFSVQMNYNRFTEQGGLSGLFDFCLSDNLPETLRFIEACYGRTDMLLTNVIENRGVYLFAPNSVENRYMLQLNMHLIADIVVQECARQRSLNIFYHRCVYSGLDRIYNLMPVIPRVE